MPSKTVLVQSSATQLIGDHVDDVTATVHNREASNKIRVGDPNVSATSEYEVAAGAEERFDVPAGERLFAVTEGAGLTATVDVEW